MREALYPGANRTARYWPTGGGTLQPSLDKLVLHSTETTGLPGYSSSSMPNLTVNPWPGQQGVWQHLRSVAMSAKALRDNGGFAENRDRVSQIEIIGYSDPARKGTGKFLPNLPPEGIEYLAEVVAWYAREWGIVLKRPAKWPAYPASYGSRAGARMSTATFDAYKGVLAHLHVPDSVHGDVTLDIDALLAAAARKLVPPKLGDRVLSKKAGRDQGADVRELIDLLTRKGLYAGDNDAVFGPKADAAVRAAQQAAGLPVTGVVDAGTLAALLATQGPTPEPAPEPIPTPATLVVLRVATLNCRDPRFGGSTSAARMKALAKVIESFDAPLVSLTECPEVLRDLIRPYLPGGTDRWLVWANGPTAILYDSSKVKRDEQATDDAYFTSANYHGFIAQRFLLDGLPVAFGAYHLSPNSIVSEAVQAVQVRKAAAATKALDGFAVIAGDGINSNQWLPDWGDVRTGSQVTTPTYKTSVTDRIHVLHDQGDGDTFEVDGYGVRKTTATDHNGVVTHLIVTLNPTK